MKTYDSGLSRRTVLKTVGTGSGGLALAGCQKEDQNNGNQADGNQVDVTGGEGQPLSGQTIDLGVLVPKPNGWAIGRSLSNGAKLAAQIINENGGIAGAKVNLLEEDTKTSPSRTQNLFNKLVRQDNVDATFGIVRDQAALQCFPDMRDSESILIGTANAGLRQTKLVSEQYEEYKYFFRAGVMNLIEVADGYLEWMEFFAEKLGWNRVAVISEDIQEFNLIHDRFTGGALNDLGVDVPIERRTSSGLTNWNPVFDDLEAANIDLALVNLYLTGTTSVTQWANQQRPFEYGGIHTPSLTHDYWGQTDGRCRYVFGINTLTPQAEVTPRSQPWLERYHNTFDEYPTYSAIYTFDGFLIYKEAVENAIREEGLTSMPSSDTLVNYLEEAKIENTVGVRPLEFTSKDAEYAHDLKHTCVSPQTCGDDAMNVPGLQQWQRDRDVRTNYGVQHMLFPEKIRTSEYHFPHWIEYPDDHPANDPDAYGTQPDN